MTTEGSVNNVIRLPPAYRATYFRWIVFWKEIESYLSDHPDGSSRSLAVSRFIAMLQAALDDGRKPGDLVAPVVEVPPDVDPIRLADDLERRWVHLDETCERVHRAPLDDDARSLCLHVVDACNRVATG